MLDVNKYLQDQLALAKQRSEEKDRNRKNSVTEKSACAAENISRKQDRALKTTVKAEESRSLKKNSVASRRKNSVKVESMKDDGPLKSVGGEVDDGSKACDETQNSCDEDSEYVPSEEEEGEHKCVRVVKSTNRSNSKKIIDDGDTKLYNLRRDKWLEDLKLAVTSRYVGKPSSADIEHILEGNANVEEVHTLKNGLKIPKYLWSKLYRFQKTGVKWLWELHQIKAGGLLGDEMGLGKTLQIIAFLTGLSKSEIGSWSGLGPTVIVVPATVIYQWVSHFHYWSPHLRVAVLHQSGSHSGNHDRLIRDINQAHGILMVTYAGIVKYYKKITDWRWQYCILDEGHKIRNPDTQVSKLLRKFPTSHRILITGSPMQNNLMELWSLYDFIRPGLLGTQNAFMDYFAIPITQGGYANATEFQEATGLEIAKALKNMITPYMLRRTKAEVQEHIKLPEKNEQVLFCALSDEQRDLYRGYLMGSTVRSILDRENKYGDPLRARILVALSTLRKICNHPDIYLYDANEITDADDDIQFGYWRKSGKMSVVHSLLKIWQKQGHRALIFTQSRVMVCILEQYLQKHKYKYLRMDGMVSVGQRQSMIKEFNDNSEYLVFLATTRVGGLGVNLTGADRVIIYDPDWNPATDTQAKERAWRIGQERSVTVYRLLSAGTIEEKIYQRQVFKQLLSNKVFSDPNQKNLLNTSNLQGLFTLEEPNREGDTETSAIFKHTKVNLKQDGAVKNDVPPGGGVTRSEKKLDAMRRKAREISKKIAQQCKSKNTTEDPRERYKKKREAILNPPLKEEPQVNIVDGKVTNIPFESILSEIDIINMHTKENYEENLIKEVLQNQELEEGELENDEEATETDVVGECIEEIIQNSTEDEIQNSTEEEIQKIDKKSKKRQRLEIENVVAVKKHKRKSKDKCINDDDYVLSKLFAKSSVKNALHHDVIVGLAEKEKRYKLKEEASRKARDAVRAVKCSVK